jgi:hypothetical protein
MVEHIHLHPIDVKQRIALYHREISEDEYKK